MLFFVRIHQIVVGSFLAGNQHEQKTKKHKPEAITAAIPISSAAEVEEPFHSSAKPALLTAPSFRGDNWSTLPPDSRNKPTDINEPSLHKVVT